MKQNYIQLGQKINGRYVAKKRVEYSLEELEDMCYQLFRMHDYKLTWYDKLFKTKKHRLMQQTILEQKTISDLFDVFREIIENDGEVGL